MEVDTYRWSTKHSLVVGFHRFLGQCGFHLDPPTLFFFKAGSRGGQISLKKLSWWAWWTGTLCGLTMGQIVVFMGYLTWLQHTQVFNLNAKIPNARLWISLSSPFVPTILHEECVVAINDAFAPSQSPSLGPPKSDMSRKIASKTLLGSCSFVSHCMPLRFEHGLGGGSHDVLQEWTLGCQESKLNKVVLVGHGLFKIPELRIFCNILYVVVGQRWGADKRFENCINMKMGTTGQTRAGCTVI